MRTFIEFVTIKDIKDKKELKILGEILSKEGLSVQNFLEEDEPYLFVNSNTKNSFGGIRIFKLGDSIIYRVQKEAKTHPYGNSYLLPIKEIYDTFLADKEDEEKAGKAAMEEIVKDIKKFFEKSSKAEKELKSGSIDFRSPLGRAVITTTGMDSQLSNQ